MNLKIKSLLNRNLRRFAEDTGGAAVIEFALGGAVLLMLIIGIMDVSNAMRIFETLQTSAKEGARYAAIHGSEALNPETNTEIIAYAKMWAIGIAPGDVNVTVTWNSTNADGTENQTPGNTVTVRSAMPYQPIGMLPSFNLGANSTFMITN